MSIHIRPFKNEEFETIQKWYLDAHVLPPLPGMLIEDGTFILELNQVPALSQTVLLPQSKVVAYLEYMIKNPIFKKQNLEEIMPLFRDYLENYAKERGYQYFLTYGNHEKLNEKYKRLGFIPSLQNLTAFYKRIVS